MSATFKNEDGKWRPFLKRIPKDPWGNEYGYQIPAQSSKQPFDLYSLGRDGVESDDDEGNWEP